MTKIGAWEGCRLFHGTRQWGPIWPDFWYCCSCHDYGHDECQFVNWIYVNLDTFCEYNGPTSGPRAYKCFEDYRYYARLLVGLWWTTSCENIFPEGEEFRAPDCCQYQYYPHEFPFGTVVMAHHLGCLSYGWGWEITNTSDPTMDRGDEVCRPGLLGRGIEEAYFDLVPPPPEYYCGPGLDECCPDIVQSAEDLAQCDHLGGHLPCRPVMGETPDDPGSDCSLSIWIRHRSQSQP
jgi:hypothetical protein